MLIQKASMEFMPNLPRVLNKREAKITPKILAWFRLHHTNSCAIEIKATDGNSIPESALAPHQRAALIHASSHGIVYKLSDESRRRMPFDAFMLRGAPAYVVAAFTTHRVAYAFPVSMWKGARHGMPTPPPIILIPF